MTRLSRRPCRTRRRDRLGLRERGRGSTGPTSLPTLRRFFDLACFTFHEPDKRRIDVVGERVDLFGGHSPVPAEGGEIVEVPVPKGSSMTVGSISKSSSTYPARSQSSPA